MQEGNGGEHDYSSLFKCMKPSLKNLKGHATTLKEKKWVNKEF